MSAGTRGYVHGFTPEEHERLLRQARFVEHEVHDRLPFRRTRKLLEVGVGVGAQTEILLRHFPELTITGVDASEPNLAWARRHLAELPWAAGRWELQRQQGLVFCESVAVPLLFPQHCSERYPGLRVPRTEPDGATEGPLGAGVVAAVMSHDAQVVPGGDIVGAEADHGE